MPPSPSAPTTNVCSEAVLAAALAPSPRKAAASALLISIIWPQRLRLALITMPVKTRRRIEVLERVAGLHRLVAHRQSGGHEQEEHEQRVGGDQADLPQARHLRVVGELRGGEHGLADQLEHRVERVEHEPLEPVVDRLADPAGQVPEVRMARLVAADDPAGRSAGCSAAAGRPGCPAAGGAGAEGAVEAGGGAAGGAASVWVGRASASAVAAAASSSLGARLIRRRSSG